MSRSAITSRLFVDTAFFDMPIIRSVGFDAINRPLALQPHNHDGFELTYLFSGEVTWITEAGESLRLTGGRMALTQPGVVHHGEYNIITPSVFFWLIFDPSAEDAQLHLPLDAAELALLDRRLRAVGNAVSLAGPMLPVLLKRLHGLLSQEYPELDERGAPIHSPASGSEAAPPSAEALAGATARTDLQRQHIRALLALLLMEATRGFEEAMAPASGSGPRLRDETVSQACAYMERHLASPLSVQDVASHVGLSVSRLHAIFRQTAGVSPADWLQRQRCAAAQVELSETERSMTDIAFSLGFTSSQYFATCFRKYTGQSPSAYRRQVRRATDPGDGQG